MWVLSGGRVEEKEGDGVEAMEFVVVWGEREKQS